VAASAFPSTVAELAPYAAVILSDIGTNTLLLHPDTFERSIPRPDRLAAIEGYVAAGGGLVMIGGYLTFQGIDGKARWAGTPVERALPVTIGLTDDRVESSAGIIPAVRAPDHAIAAGLPDTWPALLGYNRVVPRPEADVVVTVGEDPLIVAGTHGQGRAVAFTSDCGAHWCPPPFLAWFRAQLATARGLGRGCLTAPRSTPGRAIRRHARQPRVDGLLTGIWRSGDGTAWERGPSPGQGAGVANRP